MGKLKLALLPKELRGRTAILDTNLLLLQLSVLTDPALLRTFKRVSGYTIEDALLLQAFVDEFASVVTTAYVLAEVSNLGNGLAGPLREIWFTHLASYALLTEEAHVSTNVIGGRSETIRFGVADSALHFLSERSVVITADHRLAGFVEGQGGRVLNFNQYRHLLTAR